MNIDIAKIDDKIRKLQHIKELAADPEMRELLAELVTSNGNGNAPHRKSTKKAQKGSFGEMVEKACLEQPGRFTGPTIVNRLHELGCRFTAKDEGVAVYSAMRRLKDKGVIAVVEEGSPGNPAKWTVAAGQKHMKLDT